jgi:hypothetical protein
MLDSVEDPVDRLALTDEVRADLAVVLTRIARKSAHQAKTTGALDRMAQEGWRGRKYLLRLSKQYADDNSLPNDMVRDVVTRQVLDLTDLVRLRGHQR